ncbi:hypothetical protein [uncultured Microbulbifer sp.]|uniref:hypothetical protein n=1 Tax=uncultured Microbulbifer sp. TaxID=348147 RepID=UPI0026251A9C|nr:hypothetical protein [uncultured Microbulbifer sp.]
MSLRQLNKQIAQCRHDAEKQRRSALMLLGQQQKQVNQHLGNVPLPVILGLAFAAGFILEKIWQLPRTSQMIQLALSLRTF